MCRKLLVLGAVASVVFLVGNLSAATLTPVAFTGFNADCMWGPDGGNGGGFVRNYGPNYATHECTSAAYFVDGALNTGGTVLTGGLPSGQFQSELDSTHAYALGAAGGDTAVNNVLMIQGLYQGVNTGTLTLNAPGKFDTIGVLAHTVEDPSSYGGNDMAVTLNFAGGATYATTYFAADWCAGGYGGMTAVSANRGQGNYLAMADSLDRTDSACHLYETVIDIPVAYQSLNLESITFAGLNGTDPNQSQWRSTVVFAVSGHQVPEPGALALAATALLGILCFAWKRRK